MTIGATVCKSVASAHRCDPIQRLSDVRVALKNGHGQRARQVRLVPIGDIFLSLFSYLAVLLFMTNSHRAACRTFKSLGLVQFFTSSQRDKEISCFARKEREMVRAVQRELPMFALKVVRIGRTEKFSHRRREFYVVVYQTPVCMRAVKVID